MKKFSLAILVFCQIPFSQIIRISDPDPEYGPLLEESSFEYNYNLNQTAFLQSLGFSNVAEDNKSGTAWANPATVGQPGRKWPYGATSIHYSALAPDLNLMDIATRSEELTARIENVGLSVGQRTFLFPGADRDSVHDSLSSSGAKYERDGEGKEQTVALGLNWKTSPGVDHNIGLGYKHVSAPPIYDYYGKRSDGNLFDLGYLTVLGKTLTLGLSIQNLGQRVSGVKPVILHRKYSDATVARMFYVEDNSFSLTPLTVNAGIGLQQSFETYTLYLLEPKISASYSLEFKENSLKKYSDHQAYELGLTILNSFSTEIGFMLDSRTSDRVFKWRNGLNLFNHFFFGFSRMTSASVFYDSQRAFFLEFYNVLGFTAGDLTWWEK